MLGFDFSSLSSKRKHQLEIEKLQRFAYGWYLKTSLKIECIFEGRNVKVRIGKDDFSQDDLQGHFEKIEHNWNDETNIGSQIFKWVRDNTIIPSKEMLDRLSAVFCEEPIINSGGNPDILENFNEFITDPFKVLEGLNKFEQTYYPEIEGHPDVDEIILAAYKYRLIKEVLQSENLTENDKLKAIQYLTLLVSALTTSENNIAKEACLKSLQKDLYHQSTSGKFEASQSDELSEICNTVRLYRKNNSISLVAKLTAHFYNNLTAYLFGLIGISVVIGSIYFLVLREQSRHIALTNEEIVALEEDLFIKMKGLRPADAELEENFPLYYDNNNPTISSNSDSAIYWYDRAKNEDNTTLALSYLNKSLDFDPEFGAAYAMRGNIKHSQNLYHDAIEDYTVAIKCQPGYSLYYYFRSSPKWALHQPQEALMDLDTAFSLYSAEKGSTNFYFHLCYGKGIYHKSIENNDSALFYLTMALDIDTISEDLKGPTYASRAAVYKRIGLYTWAIDDYQRAIPLIRKTDLKDELEEAYVGMAIAYYFQATNSEEAKLEGNKFSYPLLINTIYFMDSALIINPHREPAHAFRKLALKRLELISPNFDYTEEIRGRARNSN